MVLYECNRCGYIAEHRNCMKRHLNRINICKPILEDTSIDEMKFLYGFEIIPELHKNSSIFPQNSSFFPQNKSSCFPQNSSLFPQKSSLLLKNCLIPLLLFDFIILCMRHSVFQ